MRWGVAQISFGNYVEAQVVQQFENFLIIQMFFPCCWKSGGEVQQLAPLEEIAPL